MLLLLLLLLGERRYSESQPAAGTHRTDWLSDSVWLYTTTLPGETDKIFHQIRRFRGLKTQTNEPTFQNGNLKNTPSLRLRQKG